MFLTSCEGVAKRLRNYAIVICEEVCEIFSRLGTKFLDLIVYDVSLLSWLINACSKCLQVASSLENLEYKCKPK